MNFCEFWWDFAKQVIVFTKKSHNIISLNKKILVYQFFKSQEVNTYLLLNKGPFCLLENSIENSE